MRIVNRVLGTILSLALVVAGLLLALEVVVAALGFDPVLVPWPDWYAAAGTTTWDQSALRSTLLIVALAGLVLLFLEFRRAPVSRLPVGDPAPGVDTAYTRRGVARSMDAALADIHGVRSVTTRVGRRDLRISTVSQSGEPEAAQALRETVTAAAQRRVGELALHPAPRISVTTKARKN